MSDKAPVALPRIRVLHPRNGTGAHAEIARDVEAQLNRDRIRRDDPAAEKAYQRLLATLRLKP